MISVKRKQDFEEVISHILTMAAKLDYENTNECLMSILKILGIFMEADRVYIFSIDNDIPVVEKLYEWLNDGIDPQFDWEKGIKLSDILPWYTKQLENNKSIIFSDIADMPEEAIEVREHLDAQNVKSHLAFPLMDTNQLHGFIGFDNIHSYMPWEDKNLPTLSLAKYAIKI